jgi:hypothetical protein
MRICSLSATAGFQQLWPGERSLSARKTSESSLPSKSGSHAGFRWKKSLSTNPKRSSGAARLNLFGQSNCDQAHAGDLEAPLNAKTNFTQVAQSSFSADRGEGSLRSQLGLVCHFSFPIPAGPERSQSSSRMEESMVHADGHRGFVNNPVLPLSALPLCSNPLRQEKVSVNAVNNSYLVGRRRGCGWAAVRAGYVERGRGPSGSSPQ